MSTMFTDVRIYDKREESFKRFIAPIPSESEKESK